MSAPPVLTDAPPKRRRSRLGKLVAGAVIGGLVAMGALWLARPAIEPEAAAVPAPPAEPAPAGFLNGGAGLYRKAVLDEIGD